LTTEPLVDLLGDPSVESCRLADDCLSKVESNLTLTLTPLLLTHCVPQVVRSALDKPVYLFICDSVLKVNAIYLVIYVTDSFLSFIPNPIGLRSFEFPNHEPIIRQG